MSRTSKLTEAQKRYIRRAVKLRRQLTNGALAKRLGVCKATITTWANAERPFKIKLRRTLADSPSEQLLNTLQEWDDGE